MSSLGRERLARALAALDERVPLGMRLGLEPMRAACARAGHPEGAFPAVHVAGTNGKGSTCAMVESIARASGLRTGLYTSPHLVRFAERIRIDGEPISEEGLLSALEESLAIGADLSFFETATLAAFLAFRTARVDLAVLEVGLGGRLDATSVIPPPRCTALVNVALDHQDKLGDSLAAIAGEKAAIARTGVPFVIGPALPDAAMEVAVDLARHQGARLVPSEALPEDVALGLAGSHQRANAAVAWTIARELGIPNAVRRRGLAAVRWPGRLERIGRFVLDGAHNPDGMAALVRAFAGEPPGAIVFGALADKSWREMLTCLTTLDAPRIYTAPAGRAPAPLADLEAHAPGISAPTVPAALRTAASVAGEDRTVVVCGSLYLVGEARAELLGLELDRIVAL